MREFGNIFGWLGRKQEQVILKDAQSHIDVTYDTVVNFKNAIDSYIKGDLESKKKFIDKVNECEKEADSIRSRMVDLLSESPLLPPDREDLMHFVKSLDRITDWTNGAARLLVFLEEKMSQDIMDNLSVATDIIFECISKLKSAVHALLKNDLSEAIKDTHEVDNLETRADDQKQILIEKIVHSQLGGPKLLVIYNIAEYLEGITDRMEDAADFIRTVAIKSK